MNVTNSLVTTTLKVRKDWIGKPAEQVEVKLLANGQPTKESLKLTSADGWRGFFSRLRQYDSSDRAIHYTVTEDAVAGYELPLYSQDSDTFVVTNKFVATKINLTATKQWISGRNFNNGLRPNVWFKLYRRLANGQLEVVPNAAVKRVVSDRVTWTGIEQTDIQGNYYQFQVKEVNMAGDDFVPEHYSKNEQHLTVINSYRSPQLNITVKK